MKSSKIKLYLFLFIIFFSDCANAQSIFEEDKYDSVYFKTDNFIIAKQNKIIKLFNIKGEVFTFKKYIAIAEVQPNVGYQIVLGDSLKMINGEGRFDDSIKFQFGMGLCGTVNKYNKTIIVRNDSTFIHFHTTHPYTIDLNEDVYATTDDTFFVTKNIDLYFLNGRKTYYSTGNDFYNPGLESNVYFEKINNGKINLLRLERVNKIISISPILSNIKLQNEIIDKNYNINYKAFIFNKANKYGYYPLQITTRYKTLKPFGGKFAAFILPNGQKGWLGVNGKEYYY